MGEGKAAPAHRPPGPSLHFRAGPAGTRTQGQACISPKPPLPAPGPERPARSAPDLRAGLWARPSVTQAGPPGRAGAAPRLDLAAPPAPCPQGRSPPRTPRRPPGRLLGAPREPLPGRRTSPEEERSSGHAGRALSHNARRAGDGACACAGGRDFPPARRPRPRHAPSVPPRHWPGALSLGPSLRETGATQAPAAAGKRGETTRGGGALQGWGCPGSPAAGWGCGRGPAPLYSLPALGPPDPWRGTPGEGRGARPA